MTYVTMVRYRVKFNGALLDSFAPPRALRQSDPLSLFLFRFVVDDLSALLRQGGETNTIQLVTICRRAPEISCFLFADYTLLFFKS